MRYLILLLSQLLAAPAIADDGVMFRKNVSNTPDMETEFAAFRMLPLYGERSWGSPIKRLVSTGQRSP